MTNRSNVFYSELNEFCRKFLVLGSGVTTSEIAASPRQIANIQATLFELFLLFDKVSLKVYGENIPLAVLVNQFGIRGVEQLIDEDAIEFILWTSMILYNKTDLPGLDPLQYGQLNSGPHTDPEESIDLGFRTMSEMPSKVVRKRLTRKLRDRYFTPEKTLAENIVKITKSAFQSGKMGLYGLSPTVDSYDNLRVDQRAILCKCAEELLEYTNLINCGMTSYTQLTFYKLFQNTQEKVRTARDKTIAFATIAELENMPDLRTLYRELPNPYLSLLKIRSKNSSRKFRQWLHSAENSSNNIAITKEYVDAIANSKGFFESRVGKLCKTVAMSSIGIGIGALAGGPMGAVVGAGAARILEPGAEFAVDLVDEYLIAGLTKGWTPKMFFYEIEKIRPKL